MYAVGVAPAAERDIRRILQVLLALVQDGKVAHEFPGRWFEGVDDAIEGLRDFPERHAYAPERELWGRDVRNVLLDTGYRILFRVYGENVWVMRVRHQRQRQLGAVGPGSAYRPELIVR